MAQNLYSLRKEILHVGKRIYDRGYVASNDGNISARVDDKRVIITPTGISKGFMKPEDLVVVDFDGKVLSGNKRPSSEVFMHLQIYKDRPDVNCVCHSHRIRHRPGHGRLRRHPDGQGRPGRRGDDQVDAHARGCVRPGAVGLRRPAGGGAPRHRVRRPAGGAEHQRVRLGLSLQRVAGA